MPNNTVAVIGAGPGGLVAARYLKAEGFQPFVFEQGAKIGGQWSGEEGRSGVWPAMRTNTGRIMTAFSDLPHDANSPTYPTNQAVRDYLERYAVKFELTPHIRLETAVRELRRDASGRDSIPDASKVFAEDVRAFGCMPSNGLTPMQIGQLQALAGARGSETFERYVESVIVAQ